MESAPPTLMETAVVMAPSKSLFADVGNACNHAPENFDAAAFNLAMDWRSFAASERSINPLSSAAHTNESQRRCSWASEADGGGSKGARDCQRVNEDDAEVLTKPERRG